MVSDPESVRERHIRKGTLGTVLYSFVPGRESSSMEIVSMDQNLLMQMVKALGIPQDESGYSNLFNGAYDGVNAGVIGLKDISRWQEENGIHMRLDRTEEEASDMEWEEAGSSLEDILPDSILMQECRTEDGLKELIQGTEYGEVTIDEFSFGSPVIERNQNGEVISACGSFHARYSADGRTYEISTDTDEEGKAALTIVLTSENGFTDDEIMAIFEHIYQSFYHGELDGGLDSGKEYATAHAQIKKISENSFSMKLF